uniref:Rin-1 n=1 Tax=Pristionchus pacificus TaxID=54126 RepID=A0A2A6CRP3_PRIPA|eukprot:PDM80882.1 rin-1 [Pristionchus pacificus]
MERPVPTPRKTLPPPRNVIASSSSSPAPSPAASLAPAASPSSALLQLDMVVPVQRPPMKQRTIFGADAVGDDSDEYTSTSGEDGESEISSPGSIRIQCQQMMSSLSSDSADDLPWEDSTLKMLSPPPSSTHHPVVYPRTLTKEVGAAGKRPSIVHKHSFHGGAAGGGRNPPAFHYQNHAAIRKAMSFRAPLAASPGTVNEYHVQNIVDKIPAASPSVASSHCDLHSSSFDPLLSPSSLPPMTLLEQIVRSHPIWYLQDIDRVTAEHLLRQMPAGTFIVRSCSRPSSMALSIRLPTSYLPSEIDHLLLVHSSPVGLRLQSSPNSFKSLPLLLEHYCTHKEELRVLLRLPPTIGGCTTTSSLQALALMGIDFWSSPHCMGSTRRDSSQSSSTSFSSSSQPPSARNSLRRDAEERKGGSFRLEKPSSSSGTASAKSSIGKSGGKKIAKLLSQGKEVMTTQLANCALFLPLRKKVSSSRSAMNIREWHRGIGEGGGLDGGRGREWNTTTTFKPNGFGRDHSIDDRLNSLAAKRMAEHGGVVGLHAPSPGPAALLPPHLQQVWAAEAAGMTASQIAALRPPQDALDALNTKQCVEELRRKRLQSTEELLGGGPSMDECSSVLRRKKTPSTSRDSLSSRQLRRHRLSAPSFPPESALLDHPSNGILESAKALRERMDKDEDGTLGTINEGLITPVVRRKGPLRETQNKADQPLLLFNRGFDRTRPSGYLSSSSPDRTPTASPVIPRKANQPRESIVLPANSVSTPSTVSGSTAGSTVACPTAPVQWSAITRELRSRQQKVAKVLPTPQTPRVSAEQKMTIRDSVASATGVASPHQPSPSPISSSLHRSALHSDYAQLSDCLGGENNNSSVVHEDDSISVAGTIFDEPWDSNTWENLLVCAGDGDAVGRVIGQTSIMEEDDDFDDEDEAHNGSFGDQNENVSIMSMKFANRALSPRPSSRAISHHSLLSMDANGSLRRPARIDSASHSIQQYIAFLATAGGTFSNSLDRFIECVKESNEKDSRLLAKNVRQFMNGMKNYLMKAGEGDLHAIIARESARLDRNSILNMDTILEDSLNRLVLKPLCEHIYHALRSTQRASPSLVTLFTNIEKARAMAPHQLGLGPKAITPSADAIEKMRLLCRKMQSHYSPHRKLEILLKASSLIFHSQRDGEERGEKEERAVMHPSAEDLVSWLVWLISRTLNVACEVEALYMNELLPVQLRQSGDGALYLSALDSAIRILSSPGGLQKLASKERGDRGGKSVNTAGGCCLIRVAVPDELLGAVDYESFPLVGDTTAVRLCRLIAHQHSITNPQDYGLYLVTDSFEQCLSPSDVIEDLKQTLDARPFLLAYKRHEARLAWPSLSELRMRNEEFRNHSEIREENGRITE